MWNVKTNVTLVKMGATGKISKSLRKYLSNKPGKQEIRELQKTAILGTTHTLGKVLMSEHCTVDLTLGIVFYASRRVNTEQLQECVP
jgi:hypothetical protein